MKREIIIEAGADGGVIGLHCIKQGEETYYQFKIIESPMLDPDEGFGENERHTESAKYSTFEEAFSKLNAKYMIFELLSPKTVANAYIDKIRAAFKAQLENNELTNVHIVGQWKTKLSIN